MNGEELIHGQNHSLLPLLTLAVHQSTGPVLELGNGHASTPNLHSLLAGTGRKLYSYDGNSDWVERFAALRKPWHVIELKPHWAFDLPEQHFGCVLIDHAADIRVRDTLRLKHMADFIVMHDTNAEGYGFAAIWPHFAHRVDDRRYLPWTSCVSNVRKLEVDW